MNPHLIIDLLTQLGNSKLFSKLDLAQAYQQVELEDESTEILTIITHKGLYRPSRLSYGIASTPGLFQREMYKILKGIERVVVFFDDIWVVVERNMIKSFAKF